MNRNQYLSLENMGNKLHLTEGRKRILQLTDEPELETFLTLFREYGVELLHHKHDLNPGDCKAWAHTMVGVAGFDGFRGRDTIARGEFQRFEFVDRLEDADLVGYFNHEPSGTDLVYPHWGVCEERDGRLMILSRWGVGGHVFRHPLEVVCQPYGNSVDYIKVLSKNTS